MGCFSFPPFMWFPTIFCVLLSCLSIMTLFVCVLSNSLSLSVLPVLFTWACSRVFHCLTMSPCGMFLVLCSLVFYWIVVSFWLYFLKLWFLVFVFWVFCTLWLFWILCFLEFFSSCHSKLVFLFLILPASLVILYSGRHNVALTWQKELTKIAPADTSTQLKYIRDNLSSCLRNNTDIIEMQKVTAIFRM